MGSGLWRCPQTLRQKPHKTPWGGGIGGGACGGVGSSGEERGQCGLPAHGAGWGGGDLGNSSLARARLPGKRPRKGGGKNPFPEHARRQGRQCPRGSSHGMASSLAPGRGPAAPAPQSRALGFHPFRPFENPAPLPPSPLLLAPRTAGRGPQGAGPGGGGGAGGGLGPSHQRGQAHQLRARLFLGAKSRPPRARPSPGHQDHSWEHSCLLWGQCREREDASEREEGRHREENECRGAWGHPERPLGEGPAQKRTPERSLTERRGKTGEELWAEAPAEAKALRQERAPQVQLRGSRAQVPSSH